MRVNYFIFILETRPTRTCCGKFALASDERCATAALMRLGKNAEAILHLEKSQDLDDDGSLHYQLARAYQAAGQADKSRAAMAKYQEIVKRNEETKTQLERETQIAPPN